MRCAIAILNPATKQGEAIYCHNEGHPEMTGRILQYHYATEEKTLGLIKLGSISWLGTRIDGPDLSQCPPDADSWAYVVSEPMGNPPTYTFAYHRDRGTDWEICVLTTFRAASTEDIPQALDWWKQFGAHYIYCWTPDGWHCITREPETGIYRYSPIPENGDW